ncbi:tetratricopeptide repeat protein [Chryseobacterium sp.]|uniref:tetratricopeptide repeat protein n=1 Tax=Chryseobacterium sp. TaxID=1871047 RepID=UPI0011C87275|nr:tetratricopeptide repeat protein [Chryseobacterium sp.]TXF77805.1 tetratricopeptide repeat protein [Chryseobacterium sp.]
MFEMNLTKKIVYTAAVGFFTNFAFAQTVQEGIVNVDSHKFAKARQIYNEMISKAPSEGDNYFYLGNTYLTQFEPNFEKAAENFNKGLAVDKKSDLNKIGLATIKLGKGDKSAIAEIQSVVKDTREKDPEILYRAAEALTMFENNNAPDIAIDYLNKAVERSERGGVPAPYYYSLGDAYRLKKLPGDAMSAYDKASVVAKNKASVFTRMGTLWMAAKQWKLAKENIDKAIAVDPTYAPAYKALANYDITYQENAKATQDLINYTRYADDDPYTLLEISKLYFTNEDYANSKATLDKVFDKVDDPIKYKLRSYIMYSEGNYAAAKQDYDVFLSKADKTRIQPADQGLQGLIIAALAKDEKDPTQKSTAMLQSQKLIAIAKAAKDETLKWDEELAKINRGGAISTAAVNSGPTNAQIEALKVKIAANPKDTDALYAMANEYQNLKNWNGAILTWQKMSQLLPDWAPAYYSLGYAYQQAGNNDMAKMSYQKFIDTVKPADMETNRQTLAYAYFAVAYMVKDSDLAKAKDYAAKSVQMDPTYQDAINLNTQLNK